MHEPEALKRKIVLTEGIVGLRFDGIIHVSYFDNVEITVDVQLRM
jgi:hypothetical protein